MLAEDSDIERIYVLSATDSGTDGTGVLSAIIIETVVDGTAVLSAIMNDQDTDSIVSYWKIHIKAVIHIVSYYEFDIEVDSMEGCLDLIQTWSVLMHCRLLEYTDIMY